MILSILSILLLGYVHGEGEVDLMPRLVGKFPLAHAGFIEVFVEEDGSQYMYITTFNAALPFFHDPVYYLKNPGNLLDSVNDWDNQIKTLGNKASAYWPNYPVHMPKEVLGFEGMVQTSGFLVPGKSDGHLEVFDTTSGEPDGPWDIAAGQSDSWSYHWVHWKDVNDDGLVDAMTARFYVPLFGGDPVREFVWFENPGTAKPAGHGDWAWQDHLLIRQGPDVYFEEHILESEGVEYSVMIASELWSENINLYYVENTPGAWAQPQNIKTVVVDAEPGQPFECHMVDLNNDGRMEILASAFDTRKGNETGNLWAYTLEGDWKVASNWKRISLSSGFTANSYLFGNSMTPGKQRLFYPSEEYKNTPNSLGNPAKPWIALSGDDDGVHYVMHPMSDELDNWDYDLKIMVDTEATTAGTMAVADLDGDGFTEIISAGYTEGMVYVYSFSP